MLSLDRRFLQFDIDNVQGDPVSKHMSKFKRTSSHPYTLITVSTPLAELEEFLKTNIFALGALYEWYLLKNFSRAYLQWQTVNGSSSWQLLRHKI